MIYRTFPLVLAVVVSAAPASGQPSGAYDPGAAVIAASVGGATDPGPAADPAIAAPGPAQGAPPPFAINDIEQQFVMQTLQMWETESAKINTFNAEFERLDYDNVWGPAPDKLLLVCRGSLSYSKPDKGSFKIDKISRWTKNDPKNPAPDAPGNYVEQPDEVGEHWVCDGKAVYEYNHREKQLVVTPIPETMRGAAIADGPLPFLFGAQAAKLVERYWIRPVTSDSEQIRLQAFPRRAADAANYDSVEVILNRKTMQPQALMVILPGAQQRHVYKFESPTVNGKLDKWFGGLFSAPRTPLGWKRVVVEDAPPPAGQQAANPGGGVQR
jgi:TIGR03009 family protein